MDYKCPVCGKELCSLDAFSRHMAEENEKAKKEEADATFKRLNELENKIKTAYDNLSKYVVEYNTISENTKCVLSLNFRQTKQKTNRVDDDIVKLWTDIFGGAED